MANGEKVTVPTTRDAYRASIDAEANAFAKELDAADGKLDGIIHRATLEKKAKQAVEAGALKRAEETGALELGSKNEINDILKTLPETMARDDVAKELARSMHMIADKVFGGIDANNGSFVGQTDTNKAAPNSPAQTGQTQSK